MTQTPKTKGLSGSSLKWLAIGTMLIDHIGAFILEPLTGPSSSQIFLTLALITRLIGRIAFPIFTFLLVEGFIHTNHLKKYVLQLGLFAILSEIPFDLAHSSVMFDFSYQNVFFTLLIGLVVITIFDHLKNHAYTRWLVPIFGMVLATFLQTDYAAIGILIIFVFYYYHDQKLERNILNGILFLLQATAVLALIPIQLYNGQRGKQNKYFFYFFYPVHLLLLFFIRWFFFQ